MSSEKLRLDEVYADYDGGRWSRSNRGYAELVDERETALVDAVAGAVAGIDRPRVLDLGCGDGADQDWLRRAMGDRGLLVGAELRFEALRTSAVQQGRLVVNADAARLPFADETFDVVLMATMLSSVLDDRLRAGIAADVRRVLRPGGRVVVYDMRVPNPQNRAIRPVTRRELTMLFPSMSLESRSLSVIPQLARAMPGARAADLYRLAHRVPLFRSHRLTMLRKGRSSVRVVHVTSSHPPTDPRIYVKEVGTLRAGGYDVVLVAPTEDRTAVADPDFSPLAARSSRLGRWLLSWPTTFRRVQGLAPDAIHFHDPDLLPVALAWQARGRKVIYDAHESLAKDVSHKPYLSPWQSRLLAPVIGWVESAVASRITHAVAATPAIAAQWDFPSTVVANFPVLDEWQAIDGSWESYQARALQGCYAGVVHPERCTDAMVAAAGALARRREATLVIAGPVSDEAIPTGDGVEYVGTLSRTGVVDLLAASRFGLVIYQPAPNIVEALPTKVLEYMAAGLPVVISESLRVGSELVREEDCGLVVPHDDPDALAAAMQSLLDDPEEAWAMGQRGREAVGARYSWSTEGDRLLSAYHRHVGPPGGRVTTAEA
ncbi:glycosyltransferase [Nocardioides pinisoli]|uniref:Glycosyltransferase n=1 Tax=Nocardioides pinisoli TaxID=2950279 RepID=A0ABT1KTD5_9ACTN|nr:glycosyltransferase [Nocardioides pinisoli]MCP3420654.1 glycosyltransferase [Nocardioides pinisoli]